MMHEAMKGYLQYVVIYYISNYRNWLLREQPYMSNGLDRMHTTTANI